ncbi:HD domain-containing phosphohydrolase [Candidatus Viridilinea mediisalina]|uniref:Phosphohydrolase n=1 Tax=Candidatus Viridilinea mediisalina TaxID=2024553 RepID=A0A2A6RGS0_9CHLR|nr:HD domain-containing phosphohydrolase [Candidatus Viridilinea mediisalina]PDW02324.1 phosphohydrolase [Candidatus Viridilinea mediisalina]
MLDGSQGVPHTHARLLIVEDDPNIRFFCQRLLGSQYHVNIAENGVLALEFLAEQTFDLVITDIQMPMMSGIQLLKQIREHHAEVDTLVMTAHATVETAREALKLGALDYIAKPIDSENLLRTVRTCLELRRVRQEKERLSDLVLMYQFSQTIATTLAIETQVEQIFEFLWRRYAPESLVLSMIVDDQHLMRLGARNSAGWQPDRPALPLPDTRTLDTLPRTHMQLMGKVVPTEQIRFAGVVLRSHGRPIGYLHMERHGEQPIFDQSERRLLGIFASQVAASLDNARLHQALKEQNRQTIEALAEAIDARDTYTYGHSRQVTRYAVRLAQAVGLPPERVALIDYAGLLHDVGKIGIRDHILLKPGKLTDEEMAMMQRHPQIGVKIIEGVCGLRETLPIIEFHHERWDGKGYPHGLAGEAIPLEARILAIADAFEAMTANRAYRPAMETAQALEILAKGRGLQWDAQLVDQFIALIEREGDQLRNRERLRQSPLNEILEGKSIG